MFQIPAILPQDHEQDAVASNVKAQFRRLEEQEIQHIIKGKHETPDLPSFVEKLKRKIYLKGSTEVEEYVGLVSQTVFDANGKVVGDTITEAQSGNGSLHSDPLNVREVPRPTGDEDADIDEDLDDSLSETGIDGDTTPSQATRASIVDKTIIIRRAGLEMLPRSTHRPHIRADKAKLRKITLEIQEKGEHRGIKKNSYRVLLRSNYKYPFYFDPSIADGQWGSTHFFRRRSLQVVTNILYICLERRDYERAWNALGCLLRERHVDVRLLWMPALELIMWRHQRDPSGKSAEDFLNWLIVNYPHLPQSRMHLYKSKPRATLFMPVSIMLYLANGKYLKALDISEQAINSAQYINDPLCWALCGISTIKANRNLAKALKYFKKCTELGGVLSSSLKIVGNEIVDSNNFAEELRFDDVASDSESESSETEAAAPENDSVESDKQDDTNDRRFLASSPQEVQSPQVASGSESGSDSQSSGEEEEGADDQNQGTENNAEPELDSDATSSQPFFSQALTIGAEMGSSDSNDDML